MKSFHVLPIAALFTALELCAISGCSSDTSAPGAAAAGSGGSDTSSAGTGTMGTAGSSSTSGNGGAGGGSGGTSGAAGAGGNQAGAGGAPTDGSAGSTSNPDGGVTDATVDAVDAKIDATSMADADAAAETGSGLTAAMIKATCSMYTGNKAFAAGDFCTLFQATCSNYIDYEPLTGCAAGPTMWTATYATWTTAQKNCRSQHLCAAAAANASTECHSAQPVTGQCP